MPQRLQEMIDEAVRRGRMTAQDAEDLLSNFVDIGRRQTQDALAEAGGMIGRSAKSVLAAIERRLP